MKGKPNNNGMLYGSNNFFKIFLTLKSRRSIILVSPKAGRIIEPVASTFKGLNQWLE